MLESGKAVAGVSCMKCVISSVNREHISDLVDLCYDVYVIN